MAVKDYQPLYDRIYEVLVDGRGTSRTIEAAHRFKVALSPGAHDDDHSQQAQLQKRVFASAARIDPRGQPETHSSQDYNPQVRLDLYYYFIGDVLESDLRASMAEAASDSHRIRRALGWPGNLTQTEAGDETGLGSGSLRMVRWQMDPPNLESRLFHASMLLVGVMTMN